MSKYKYAKKIFFVFILIIAPGVLNLYENGIAQDAKPSNVVVTNTRDNLLLYMKVENAFNEKIRSAILSGVPVSFSFYISVDKMRNFWPNKIIRDKEIFHTIKYDTLKKEFSVEKSWEKGGPFITQSFEEARKKMTEINCYRLVKLKRINRGERHQLRVKAKLNKLSLPYHLDYILFFVSRWDFETDWYTLEFIY